MAEMKQVHTDISMAKWKELISILPESRMVSLLIRALISKFIYEVKYEGKNPWTLIYETKMKEEKQQKDVLPKWN